MHRIEYKIRPIIRYHATRWEAETGKGEWSESLGEFATEDAAFRVASALALQDRTGLGWHAGDERLVDPVRPSEER